MGAAVLSPFADVDSGRVCAAVFSIVAQVRDEANAAPRYQDRSVTVDADLAGEGHRHIAKGGFWNDNGGRAALGFTKADAATVRRELRAIGLGVTLDEAEALLAQAEMGYLSVMASKRAARRRPTAAQRRVKERTKRASRVERARAEGRCTTCCGPEVLPARADGTTPRTCTSCIARISASNKDRRAQRAAALVA